VKNVKLSSKENVSVYLREPTLFQVK